MKSVKLLYSTQDTVPEQLVFGQLLVLALDTVKHHHSDFYHDANWLRKHLQEVVDSDAPFYYCIDKYGTHIGTDGWVLTQTEYKYTYKVTVQRRPTDGWWYMKMERVSDDD